MLGKGAAATTYRVFMGGQSDVSDGHAGVVEKTEGEAVVVKRLRRREGATREDERRRRELVREMGSWAARQHRQPARVLRVGGGASPRLRLHPPRQPPQPPPWKQDVRDFGVIVLEILTGRSPEDGKVDMPRWVRTVVREEWTSEVFDMELLRGRGAEDEMVALLQVALLCAADDPKERPEDGGGVQDDRGHQEQGEQEEQVLCFSVAGWVFVRVVSLRFRGHNKVHYCLKLLSLDTLITTELELCVRYLSQTMSSPENMLAKYMNYLL
ncbi:hypothetical protein ACQ4PT_028569 [Festuca glaucescens]